MSSIASTKRYERSLASSIGSTVRSARLWRCRRRSRPWQSPSPTRSQLRSRTRHRPRRQRHASAPGGDAAVGVVGVAVVGRRRRRQEKRRTEARLLEVLGPWRPKHTECVTGTQRNRDALPLGHPCCSDPSTGGVVGSTEAVRPRKVVLVVEDERAIGELIADAISDEPGYCAIHVGEPTAAIEATKHVTPDVMIVDVR